LVELKITKRFLSNLSLAASFFALGVIALGAFTRLIDAGLGCPDWPGCYGHLAVPTTESATQLALNYPGSHLTAYKAWAEMIHRYFVGGLSLFILSIVAIIFSQKILRVRYNIILATTLILLLVYQILLGQWTVTLKLLPIIVTQHLLGGFFILSTLWLIYLGNNQALEKRLRGHAVKAIIFGALGALIILLLQISLGAWTSTNYASLSCPDFPFCMNDQTVIMHFKEAFTLFTPIGVNYEGGVLPDAIRQTIQMAHRFGALILTSYLFLLMIFSSLKLKRLPELLKSLYVVLGLLCVQLCIGISNVIFKLPLITAISHNLVAVLLLLAMITLIYKLVVTNRKVSEV